MIPLPRVLIFGQPFNNRHGGGITLSNLFRGWDKDKLAVAATGHVMKHVTTDVCDTYYQLGKDEFKWLFPFSLIQKKFDSGVISFNQENYPATALSKKGVRFFLVNKILYPVLKWLGLYHGLSAIHLSARFRIWLEEFNPEILYLQVSTRDTILFAKELYKYLQIPGAIHMMDDWPSTISTVGPFKRLWEKKIDNEFRQLLKESSLALSISEAMSDEYLIRYGKVFKPFHNPIDVDLWEPYIKKDFRFRNDHINVLFSGRIGKGITQSLTELVTVIDTLNAGGVDIRLIIQSPSVNNGTLKKLSGNRNIVINPLADYSELPAIYSNADLLIILNDFDKESINFLRYSMPTKASELMISGTPIIVFSHSDTAISKFFRQNECGHCVTEHDMAVFADAFRYVISNEAYREKLSRNAVRVSSNLFDARRVRAEFKNDILSIKY